MLLLSPLLLLLLATPTYSKPPPPDSGPFSQDPKPGKPKTKYAPFNISLRRFNNPDCTDYTGKHNGPKKFEYEHYIGSDADGHCEYFRHEGEFKSFDYNWAPVKFGKVDPEWWLGRDLEWPKPGSEPGVKRTCGIWLYAGKTCEGEEFNILDHANLKTKMMKCIPVQDRQGRIRRAQSVRVKCWNVPENTP